MFGDIQSALPIKGMKATLNTSNFLEEDMLSNLRLVLFFSPLALRLTRFPCLVLAWPCSGLLIKELLDGLSHIDNLV